MELMKRLYRLFIARNKEFYRDRGSMSWNLLFPVLIIAGFAFAYSGKPKPLFAIGVVEQGLTAEQSAHAVSANEAVVPKENPLSNWQYARLVAYADDATSLEKAIEKVSRHQLDLLVKFEGTTGKYWVNPSSPQGDTLVKMLASVPGMTWTSEDIKGEPIRFVDWLTPGVIGINMMFSALFGVGYVLVRYRKSGVLKRLKATPVRAWEFLAAQIMSRFILVMVTTTVIFAGAIAILGIPVRGSYASLAVVLASGTLCLISMGLIIAARVSSEELAGGLLNMMSWPMMFLSGVWFSLEGLNPVLQKVSLLSPLTHMVSACRAIMIDGAHIYEASVAVPIAVLLGIATIGLSIGAMLFRWE